MRDTYSAVEQDTQWLTDEAMKHNPVPCKSDPDLFFLPETGINGKFPMSEDALDARIEQAKDMCLDCPFMFQCLDRALLNEEVHGVWGGEWFVDGVPGKRVRRGRPRKDAATIEEQMAPLIPHVPLIPIRPTPKPLTAPAASKPLTVLPQDSLFDMPVVQAPVRLVTPTVAKPTVLPQLVAGLFDLPVAA